MTGSVEPTLSCDCDLYGEVEITIVAKLQATNELNLF